MSVSNIIEFRHIRCFQAVVSTMNITRAAELLHMSQPALSRTIMQLEEELGLQLLERITSTLHLTNAGKVFAKQANTVLLELEKASKLAKLAGAGTSGQLTVGVVREIFGSSVATVLMQFRRDHPEIDLVIDDSPLGEAVNKLTRRELDIVLHFTHARRPGIGVKFQMEPEQLYVVSPVEHSIAEQDGEIDITKLDGANILLNASSTLARELLCFQLDLADAGVRPQIAEAHSAETALGLVAMGAGLALEIGSPLRNGLLQGTGLTFRPLPAPWKVVASGNWYSNNTNPLLPLLLRCFGCTLAEGSSLG